MDRSEDASSPIGWVRAIVTAGAVVAVAFVALVLVPDELVGGFSSLGRSVKVLLVTVWFFVGLFAIGWGLRRLQRRGLI